MIPKIEVFGYFDISRLKPIFEFEFKGKSPGNEVAKKCNVS